MTKGKGKESWSRAEKKAEAAAAQRRKQREKRKQRMKDEVKAAGYIDPKDLKGLSREERKMKELQAKQAMEAVREKQREEEFNRKKARRQNMYEYEHGRGRQQRDINKAMQDQKRRELTVDFYERRGGQDEYKDKTLADFQTGRAHEQGSIDAYTFLQDNLRDIQRGKVDFYFDDFFPQDQQRRQRRRPTLDQYMGKFAGSYDEYRDRRY